MIVFLKLIFSSVKALQSGGPRTTPSGYPGGPVVPSGNLSPPSHYPSSHQHHHHHPGYATTGRISHHQTQQLPQQQQQQPMSFTRALEVSESISDSMRHQQPGSGLPPPPNAGVNPNHHAQFQGPGGVPMEGAQSAGGAEGDRRESVYDYHEISV